MLRLYSPKGARVVLGRKTYTFLKNTPIEISDFDNYHYLLSTGKFFREGESPPKDIGIDYRPLTVGVFRIGGFGDALLSSCAITALTRKYPRCRLTAFSYSTVMKLWKKHPHINLFDTRQAPSMNGAPVLKSGMDAFYNLMPDSSYLFGQRIQEDIKAKAKKAMDSLIPYKKAPGNLNHLTKFCRDNDFGALDVYNYLFDLDCSLEDMYIPQQPHDIAFFKRRSDLAPYNYITIHDWAFAGRQTKSWFPEYWKAMVTWLNKEYDMPVVQLGTEREQSLGANIDLRGKTTFGETTEIIKNALFHIDNESTPAHIAPAVGTPCVCLHGPTNQYWRHKENFNVSSEYECKECEGAPSWHNRCMEGSNAGCMRELTPDFLTDKIMSNKNFLDKLQDRYDEKND